MKLLFSLINGDEGFPSGRGVDSQSEDGVFVKCKHLPYNVALKEKAKLLRKAGNISEVALWDVLKKKKLLGLKFIRQKISGNYIVDFYCPNLGIVIEIDGGSHDFKGKYDVKREKYFETLELEVLHIADIRIKTDFDNVKDEIFRYCFDKKTPR